MDTRLRSQAIETAVRRCAPVVAAEEDVHGIVLFGSVARGEAREDSDCDVAIIARHERVQGHVEAALADAVEGLGVSLQTFWMGPWNDYGGAGVWGRMGREVLVTGRVLVDDGMVGKMKKMRPRKLSAEEVGKQLMTLMAKGRMMCGTLAHYRAAEGEVARSVWHDEVAASSAMAAEMLVKHACLIRGHSARYTHTANEIVGAVKGDALVPERREGEHGEYLKALAERVNGHGGEDHVAPYLGHGTRQPMSALVRRAAHVLDGLHEECERACEVFGTKTMRSMLEYDARELEKTARGWPASDDIWAQAAARWKESVGARTEAAEKQKEQEQERPPRKKGRRREKDGGRSR